MPQAKKNKIISLTKVKPKMRDHKQIIVKKVRTYLNKFTYTYVLTYQNMTTNNFKIIRQSQTQSKFMMGKNKVMGIAFGTNQQNSYKPNSYQISQMLKGHCAIFFTNKKPQECRQLFAKFQEQQFATAGTIAQQTIILQKGFHTLQSFSHSMEPHLRQLGLPTRLMNSQIQLMNDYIISQQGKPLTVNQCKLLKLLGKKMSRLKFEIKGYYNGKKVY